jgi:hypothetical protein
MVKAYRLEPERQRITVVIDKVVRAADLAALMERQALLGAWSYDVVYDETASPGAMISLEEIRRLLDRAGQLSEQHGRRGRIAIVNRTTAGAGVPRVYASMAESRDFRVKVFADVESAHAWLDTWLPEHERS